MNILAFELKGKTAFFKKPDVNANVYFTYNHIHKIGLLGMLGAILGYGGYTQQKNSIERDGEQSHNQFPEFYEKLKGLKVSIVPHGDRGYFSKKIQSFNNSVGYASKEVGGNLIVREQWLENPHWTIYIQCTNAKDMSVFEQLKQALLTSRYVYIPYLGKNDHPATIESVRSVPCEEVGDIVGIESFVSANSVEFKQRGGTHDGELAHFSEEYMPIRLNSDLNFYEFEKLVYTNRKLQLVEGEHAIYQVEGKVVAFI